MTAWADMKHDLLPLGPMTRREMVHMWATYYWRPTRRAFQKFEAWVALQRPRLSETATVRAGPRSSTSGWSKAYLRAERTRSPAPWRKRDH